MRKWEKEPEQEDLGIFEKSRRTAGTFLKSHLLFFSQFQIVVLSRLMTAFCPVGIF